ncbi:hypothetical protein GPX89_40125 [Nocardia sp. ET3-3]|uniref:LppU protein n=1 Tax=Nocardia terrae TaxID=2675851 RepID=A0A7K1V9W0_9NOCA|nr:hypothetical protein [Nocardia terrae]MVU83433.1 hypothetical protein [Nocardia terrae]
MIIAAIGVVLLVAGLVLVLRPKSAPADAAPSPLARLPKNSGAFIAIAGVLVLALGLLASFTHSSTAKTAHVELAVGNCVTSKDYRTAQLGKIQPTPCDDHTAVYELAAAVKDGGTCPDGKLRDAGYFVLTDGSHSLCFAPNVKVGDCFSLQDTVNQLTPVDCAATGGPGVTVKVDNRFDGITDPAGCVIPQAAMVTTQPPRVVCWKPVQTAS